MVTVCIYVIHRWELLKSVYVFRHPGTFKNWRDKHRMRLQTYLAQCDVNLSQNPIYYPNPVTSCLVDWEQLLHCILAWFSVSSQKMPGILWKVWIFTFPQCAITLVNTILFVICLKEASTRTYIRGVARPSPMKC